MGLDFIRNATKSFHKGLDRSRIDLCTPNLFTIRPEHQPQAYAVRIIENQKLNPGEELCVRFHDGKVVAQRGRDVVAELDRPTSELVEALRESHGEACGIVREVYEIADTAEITIC